MFFLPKAHIFFTCCKWCMSRQIWELYTFVTENVWNIIKSL